AAHSERSAAVGSGGTICWVEATQRQLAKARPVANNTAKAGPRCQPAKRVAFSGRGDSAEVGDEQRDTAKSLIKNLERRICQEGLAPSPSVGTRPKGLFIP